MDWNIATTRQQFSEAVRLSAQEPRAIDVRDFSGCGSAFLNPLTE
ncbi:hypothetical protein [Pseudorhodoferax sp. Leaf267]|nr:hypothetical protein [Pseudorhodoferax sp. Leaf267]